MKTALLVCAFVFASGCATNPAPSTVTRTYTVVTTPIDAHVKLLTQTGRVLAAGDTRDHRIEFSVEVPVDEIVHATATAAGYRQRPYIYSDKTQIELRLVPHATGPTAPPEASAAERRQAHIARMTDLTPEIQRAVLEGRVIAGMDPLDVRAAVGGLEPFTQSDGLGGSLDTWYHNDGSWTTYYYFRDGALVRWQRVSNR